jgi:hypothetical protein
MNPDLIIVPTVFATFAWAIWIVSTSIRRYWVVKAQTQVQSRLLDKLGASPELLAYLQTTEGVKFLNSLTADQVSPYVRILSATQTSIVMICTGAVLLFLRTRASTEEKTLLVFGGIILAMGVGFGLSAIASYRLSRSFGLLTDQRSSD